MPDEAEKLALRGKTRRKLAEEITSLTAERDALLRGIRWLAESSDDIPALLRALNNPDRRKL